jgi:hypothetical protein
MFREGKRPWRKFCEAVANFAGRRSLGRTTSVNFQASRSDQQGRLPAQQDGPWGQPGDAPGGAEAEAQGRSRRGKWSGRTTLLFIVVSCGLFWAVVAVAAHFLLKR